MLTAKSASMTAGTTSTITSFRATFMDSSSVRFSRSGSPTLPHGFTRWQPGPSAPRTFDPRVRRERAAHVTPADRQRVERRGPPGGRRGPPPPRNRTDAKAGLATPAALLSSIPITPGDRTDAEATGATPVTVLARFLPL